MSALTVEKLQKNNPELYSQCIELGVRQERERCISLLHDTGSNPASRYAIKCIKDGSPLGYREQVNYLCMQIQAFRKAKKAAMEGDIVASMVEASLGVYRDENINH